MAAGIAWGSGRNGGLSPPSGSEGSIGLPSQLVVIDTSSWLHHLRYGDRLVERLMACQRAAGHVDIAGELIMGCGPDVRGSCNDVLELPQLEPIPACEAIRAIESLGLRCRGIGWTDAGIILSCLHASPPAALCTRDRRMAIAARAVGILVVEGSPADSA